MIRIGEMRAHLKSKQNLKDHNELSNDRPLFVFVDDDPHILNVLMNILNHEQVNYEVFQDPLSAMNFISKNKIAHVFCDYHMNRFGVSGKWIKEMCLEKDIKCSIVSGDASLTDINKMDFVSNCVSYIKASEND